MLKRKTPLRAKKFMARKPLAKRRKKTQSVKQKDCHWRSEKYLAFVRSLPCCACGSPANAAHHIIGMYGLSGMGLKAPDSYAMPVCDGPGDTCHRLIHSDKAFRDMQPFWLRKTLKANIKHFGGDTREHLQLALAFIDAKESGQ